MPIEIKEPVLAITVFNLDTDERYIYTNIDPRQAVVCAYEQAVNDNWDTWDYPCWTDHPEYKEGEYGWHCGSMSTPKPEDLVLKERLDQCWTLNLAGWNGKLHWFWQSAVNSPKEMVRWVVVEGAYTYKYYAYYDPETKLLHTNRGGCPRSFGHHVGSTCGVCGLKD